jgi:hypothetical protein
MILFCVGLGRHSLPLARHQNQKRQEKHACENGGQPDECTRYAAREPNKKDGNSRQGVVDEPSLHNCRIPYRVLVCQPIGNSPRCGRTAKEPQID